MIITIEQLLKEGACSYGRMTFLEAFPKGKVSFKVLMKTVRETELTYHHRACLEWLVCYPGLNTKERQWLIKQSHDPARKSGRVAAYRLDIPFAERLKLIKQSDTPGYWAREAMICVAGLTDEQKEQLIEMY